MPKLKTDPLSGLFLLQYKNNVKKDVFGHLLENCDLDETGRLYENSKIIMKLLDKLFENKYYFIRENIKEILIENEDSYLIIILAAGKSPLALDLLESNYGKIEKIFEIDKEDMQAKKQIYDTFYPTLCDKIKCISADFKSAGILSNLSRLISEYYADKSCIIVYEGFTFLLEEEDICRIIKSFRSTERKNFFFLDFIDFDSGNEKMVFADFLKFFKNQNPENIIKLHKSSRLKDIFEKENSRLQLIRSQNEIENLRAGQKEVLPGNQNIFSYTLWNI